MLSPDLRISVSAESQDSLPCLGMLSDSGQSFVFTVVIVSFTYGITEPLWDTQRLILSIGRVCMCMYVCMTCIHTHRRRKVSFCTVLNVYLNYLATVQ